AQREGYSPRCSCTIRTARSRTSGENLDDFFMAPFSHELEPPQNPGRFNSQNSHLMLYGWTRDPLVEYQIVETYGSWNPSGCAGNIGTLGSFQSDGVTYDVLQCQRFSQGGF